MATRKRAGAKAKKANKSTKKAAVTRKAAKAPAKAAAKKPAAKPSPKRKPRAQPESLRLRSAMPSLTVDDVAKSLAFYRDGLGFVVTDEWKKDGEVLGYMLKAGACEIGIGQDDWAKGRDRVKGIGYRLYYETTQDVDAIAKRVQKAGYELAEPVEDHPDWGSRSFAVADPDGFKISIHQKLGKK
jgi:lactoylglutathione lyase